LADARRVLFQISECDILFSDFGARHHPIESHENAHNQSVQAPSAPFAVRNVDDSASAILAAKIAAQVSIEEASSAARISRYSARDALLLQAESAIAEIPPSPSSPAVHYDFDDAARQHTLYRAAAACCTSSIEALCAHPAASTADASLRSRSAITIQRAWRRPLAYFDSVMSEIESLNCSRDNTSDAMSMSGNADEDDDKAVSAFDEAQHTACALIARSVGCRSEMFFLS
jgi:hypothetical protein